MSAKPSHLEQLTALGYRLLTGNMRFTAAMSSGCSVYAQDQVGALVKISCNHGELAVDTVPHGHKLAAPAFQVQRTL
jgi:hypothetical protein